MKKLTLFLLIFNSIGALFGGAILILVPSGEAISMPHSMLKHSPFTDFLYPGIVLLLGNGLLSMLSAILVSKNHLLSAYFVLGQGLFLSLWILIQIYMIRGFYPPLHLFYLGIGILLTSIGFLMMRKKI